MVTEPGSVRHGRGSCEEENAMTDQPDKRARRGEDPGPTADSWPPYAPDATQPLPRRDAIAEDEARSPYWWSDPSEQYPPPYSQQYRGSGYPTPPSGYAYGVAHGSPHDSPSDATGRPYSGYGDYGDAVEPIGSPPGRGAAIGALVCGVLALLLGLLPFLPLFLGIVASVLGVIALRRMAAAPARGRRAGRGLAITGLIAGIIATLLGTIVGVAYIVTFRILGPYVDDVVQCSQLSAASAREECLVDVLDDMANTYGDVDVPALDSPERLRDVL